MRLLRHLLAESHATLALAVVASLVNGAATAGLLALLNDLLVLDGSPGMSVLLSYPALLFAIFASGVLAQVLLVGLAADVAARLRILLARQVLALPLARLETLGVNRLYATLTQDVTAVSNAWIALPILSFHVAILLGGVVYLAWLSPALLLFTLVWFALGIAVYQWIARRGQALLRSYRGKQDDLFARFETLLRGTKELKLDRGRRDFFLARSLEPTVDELRGLQSDAFRAWAVGTNWASVLTFVVIGLVLGLGALALGAESSVATGFVVAILFLRAHVGGALGAAPALAQGDVALGKIQELGLGEAGSDRSPPPPRPGEWSSLVLRGAEYQYKGEGFRLGPVDLELRPGELVFVTGGNGSGKSTFAKLLTGLYEPSCGEVRVDGEPIPPARREWYAAHFSAVFSDFFVFDELQPGSDGDADQRARDHLARFELSAKVGVEDGRVSTTKLSLGERKRLALIAAYLQDRPIVVLDEWAADQDVRFKDMFYREILEDLVQRGKTVVVITHDDRYFGLAHRLVRLEDGRFEALVGEPSDEPTKALRG